MGTGIHKLIVVATIVAAFVMAAPAFGTPALPEDYQLSAVEPSIYTPRALEALGARGEAMARFYEESTGYSPQALQALNGRWEAMAQFYGGGSSVSARDANERQFEPFTAPDAHQRQFEASQPVLVGDEGSFDWGAGGIVGGTAALLAVLGIAGVLAIRVRTHVAHP